MRANCTWTIAISAGAPRKCCYAHAKADTPLYETLSSTPETVSNSTTCQTFKSPMLSWALRGVWS